MLCFHCVAFVCCVCRDVLLNVCVLCGVWCVLCVLRLM